MQQWQISLVRVQSALDHALLMQAERDAQILVFICTSSIVKNHLKYVVIFNIV